jgi:hypothetical protein
MEIWAFSLMELGILLLIILWSIQNLMWNAECGIRNFRYEIIFISIFLALILFQMIPLPTGIVKILSPKTYELRHALAVTTPQSAIRIPDSTISFVPFLTKIEFYKWLTLIALFLFLLHWKFLEDGFRITSQLIIVIFVTGVFESFMECSNFLAATSISFI